MEPKPDTTPLVAIVGQTASGKTAMAIELAKRFNGEIICADSRTIYKGMDIGTAKPTKEELATVPHHLIDITTIDKPITVAQFKNLADDAINDIAFRGKLPFLVGGSGLYIDAVVRDFSFRGGPDYEKRQELESLSVAQLQKMHQEQGIPLPNNSANPRHLIRQLETGGQKPVASPRPNTLLLGIALEKEELKARIELRTAAMFEKGLESEVRNLVSRYGWDNAPLQTIGYQEFQGYFEGEVDREEVERLIVRHTLQYAKRQKTWFKRNISINWICKLEESVDLITTALNKNYISK